MRKKIIYTEYRISFIFTDLYTYLCSVRFYYNTMKCKRYYSPLIFLYTAIVMSLEISYLVILIYRALLQIYSWRVDMCSTYINTVFNVISTYNSHHDSLSTVINIYLVSSLKSHSRLIRLISIFFQKLYSEFNSFSLCLY